MPKVASLAASMAELEKAGWLAETPRAVPLAPASAHVSSTCIGLVETYMAR